ncbi:hypothetical protein E1B28_003164 [Marasmius oreades]|uniref:Spt20-like SEP domain-containing protein n=1 Tax=Marasmius oreades TaxID=181124 RepID=A0A9P7RM03_9AGAR|nr:uncharacterized protein E1B28_003164 [Marasmius oreades]KAG7085615.1 hypothetical protein E1B28_003164 [Marasmius oreades]
MGSYNLTRYSEELLERTKREPPSLTVHLHGDHFNLNASKKWSYTHPVACIFDDIRAHRIPVDFLELFDKANIPFYDGCMIVELLDYRSHNKNEPVLERPEQKRMILHPNGETLWADICLLNATHGKKWTDRDILEIEARILLATAPPLCLDPDPHLTRIANHVLRVSTPTEPALLKRKADVVEPEERETEKAKRAKIMQFGNPRLNRPYAPSYRILDALDRKSKGNIVIGPPPAPKPQPTRSPSRGPSQTPAPQASARPLTPSSQSSAHPSPAPVTTPTPYNLPHSPAPPPVATVPTPQPPQSGPADDTSKRLQTKPPLPPTQTFTIPIHSTPSTSALPVGATTNVNAIRTGAQTPVPVPFVIATGPPATPYQHLMPTQRPNQAFRRSVSPTKPQLRASPSPAPSLNSQQQAPVQATAQAHLYPSVQAATAAAAGHSPPSNVTSSPANEQSPTQGTELAKRAATPVGVIGATLSPGQQQRYSQSPRVMPAVMRQSSPQAQVHPGRSATPAASQQPLSGHQQSPPSQHRTGPVSQHQTMSQQNGYQAQYTLQRNNMAQPTPTAASSQVQQQQQSGATTSAITGGTPAFMVNPASSQVPAAQPNPGQNPPIQALQVQPGQQLTPQQQQQMMQLKHNYRMRMLHAQHQQRVGTPANQGMMRGTPVQLQQIQQQHQQQHQQQMQQMQQHASPRPTTSQSVVSSPIVSAAQSQAQSQRTVTPAPGTIPNTSAMGPGSVRRGSPMLVNNQRMTAASPMPVNAQPMNPNVNPNPGVNSPRMNPQQAGGGHPNPVTVPGGINFNPANFAHYQAQLVAQMRQQATATPAPGAGLKSDGQNPGTPQRPQQPQQNQPPVGMPQQSSQNPNQNQTQTPGMQQQQHAYPMFYATAGQPMGQGYWPGVVSQHGGVNPAIQNMGQNGQATPQQQMQFYQYMMGRGRGFQHQQQGRGGGPGNIPGR